VNQIVRPQLWPIFNGKKKEGKNIILSIIMVNGKELTISFLLVSFYLLSSILQQIYEFRSDKMLNFKVGILAIIVILLVTACGSKEPSETTATTTTIQSSTGAKPYPLEDTFGAAVGKSHQRQDSVISCYPNGW
jgi:hypothetical protein